ncbi:MAG: NADH:flavin oxidoreductase/NADH oxidase [Candidatus Obscuribacterales bacterium]|nr:NADH:flavin oxidoreductase/NADH oxidase [Candidatus Obscuribacterales bacterium]
MKRCELFEPLTIRGVSLKNRIAVSPMCQYSSEDGSATDWHMVHLGARAAGGAGLVICEATAVEARGRISPDDMGIWSDKHIEPFKRINQFIHSQGSVSGIQLAHAGRKASTSSPWKGRRVLFEGDGGWPVVGPSAIAFSESYPMPEELSLSQIDSIVESFALGARRAIEAGFGLIEIHNAHGYLLHSFNSPLSNKRQDEYGGNLTNRIRFSLRVVEAVRSEMPEEMPLFVRISACDWVEGGWSIDDSVELARCVKDMGVDLIDCSSGALVPYPVIPEAPGYQVQFAEKIRSEAGIATGAVGRITDPHQAERIIATGQADIVLLARELLRDPHWPLHAASALAVELDWPVQYARAKEG